MITPDYARTMARYNRWQNQSLVAAADTLTDATRWQDGGAAFRSIAETLNHVLWDDRVWLARMQGDASTAAKIDSRHPYTDTPRAWASYKTARAACDGSIVDWADTLTDADLARPTRWKRGSEPVETALGFNLVHLFTHQTHHRGQVHALLTRAGATPEPTDLQMLHILHPGTLPVSSG
ncbi:DinB family protein [Tateyamaria sp. SN6-1]|uniref:DinB family protein n=1 Tax=Tateyamaria sp. SN6-1 TaxID=3092148 RepID=UPI0039F5A28C